MEGTERLSEVGKGTSVGQNTVKGVISIQITQYIQYV